MQRTQSALAPTENLVLVTVKRPARRRWLVAGWAAVLAAAVGLGTQLAPKTATYPIEDPTESTPSAADQTAKVASELKIPYPAQARRAGVQGMVKVRIVVDNKGNVTEARTIQGPGFGLDEAAREALLHFKFTPAQKGGKPVSAVIFYNYNFVLD